MNKYLTEIRKDSRLFEGEPIYAKSFSDALYIAMQRNILTRVLGQWLFTLTDITNFEADMIINDYNCRGGKNA